jgi:hypothetical protein
MEYTQLYIFEESALQVKTDANKIIDSIRQLDDKSIADYPHVKQSIRVLLMICKNQNQFLREEN